MIFISDITCISEPIFLLRKLNWNSYFQDNYFSMQYIGSNLTENKQNGPAKPRIFPKRQDAITAILCVIKKSKIQWMFFLERFGQAGVFVSLMFEYFKNPRKINSNHLTNELGYNDIFISETLCKFGIKNLQRIIIFTSNSWTSPVLLIGISMSMIVNKMTKFY